MLPAILPPGFEGTPAIEEVCKSIAAAGVEPNFYCGQWENLSGINARSGLCLEHRILVFAVWYYAAADGLDPGQSAAMEHLARRLLQIERAVKRNHKNPDFESLGQYTDHMAEPGMGVRAPGFDAHIAAKMKTENYILKEARLAREEQEAIDKKKKEKGKE